MTALVIVPTYNERDNLPLLVDKLMQLPNVSLLVVDDASPDGTGEVAEALARVNIGPHRSAASHGTARPRALVHRRHPPRDPTPGRQLWKLRRDLPDGRGPLARSATTAGARRARTADADVVLGSRYIPAAAW